MNDTKIAGVIARPPLLFLAVLLLGLASDRLLPWPFAVPGTDLVYWMSGSSMILVGLALAAAGIRNFSRAGTPVPTNQPTRMVVTTGIHGWTRNPIYLGMFLVCGGIGIAARSPWTLILMLPLAITIRYGWSRARNGTWRRSLARPTVPTGPPCVGGSERTSGLEPRAP